MALSWRLHGTFMSLSCHFHFNPKHGPPNSFMTLSWQIHGTFMALSTASNLSCSNKSYSCHFHGTFSHSSRLSLRSFRQFFMGDSLRFPLKTPKLSKSTISYSSQIHVRFMPLSWRFHGTFMAALKTLLQTLSCHFHGTFSEHYGKILIYHFLCLSVCLSSVCFFSSSDMFIDGLSG